MVKLFDSERKVMEVLWREGEMPAGQIVKILKEETGWNRNTTYTVVKKCVDKDVVMEVGKKYFEELIDKMFDGSKEKFFAAFLDGKKLSGQEIEQLRKMVNDLEREV